MRLRRTFVIATIVALLSVAAVIFVAFSDIGSAKEPTVNGLRVRRYVAYTMLRGPSPAGVGPEAIPWLIKGLDAKDSTIHKLKVEVWKLLPKRWRSKWRNHEPINPRMLRISCARALGMFGPEAVAVVPELIALAKADSSSDVVAFTALAQMAPDSPKARAFLVTSLRDGDDAMKTKVASTFGDTGFTPPEAVPLLVTRLKTFVPPAQGSTLPVNEMSALSVCGPEAAPAAVSRAICPARKTGNRAPGIASDWPGRSSSVAAVAGDT